MTRLVLVLICLLLVVLVLGGMRLGWRHRLARQAELPQPPTAPANPGRPLLRASGVYVGSAFATSWQDRVVHGGLGLRSAAEALLYPTGLLFDRDGAEPVFVPAAALVEARLAPGLAGKVMGAGGLLVVRWRLGAAEVDTGFRADDKTSYPEWVRAITALGDASPAAEAADAPPLADGQRHSADEGSSP